MDPDLFFLIKIKKKNQFLKVPFHVQLSQNLGYIPRVVQTILDPILYPVASIFHSAARILPLPLFPQLLVLYIGGESASFLLWKPDLKTPHAGCVHNLSSHPAVCTLSHHTRPQPYRGAVPLGSPWSPCAWRWDLRVTRMGAPWRHTAERPPITEKDMFSLSQPHFRRERRIICRHDSK